MPWTVKSHEASKAGGAEPIGDYATEEMMIKAMGGVFAPEEVDHKCGNCWMRVLIDKGDIADCTVVKGGIHLKRGVCNFWDEGAASSKEDIAPERMSYATGSDGVWDFSISFRRCVTGFTSVYGQ